MTIRFAHISTTALLAGLAPLPALAHPGHLAEVAGHGHWLGAAALGAAIAIGLWASRKPKKADSAEARDDAEAEEAEAPDEELQEA